MQIPGFDLYGGATITRAVDGAGQVYIACCARRLADSKFGFWVFRNGQPLDISPFCGGRGSINNAGVWVAWDGEDYREGQIPGFVPHPAPQERNDDALLARIAELEARLSIDNADRIVIDGLKRFKWGEW